MPSTAHLFVSLVVIELLAPALADYTCVCSYAVERNVYSKADNSASVLGYIYEFDCKEHLSVQTKQGWYSIAYQHHIGYIEVDSSVEIQTCPGDAPTIDKVTTPITTEPTTTLTSTTTPPPTSLTTTKPLTTTTIQPTTNVPITTTPTLTFPTTRVPGTPTSQTITTTVSPKTTSTAIFTTTPTPSTSTSTTPQPSTTTPTTTTTTPTTTPATTTSTTTATPTSSTTPTTATTTTSTTTTSTTTATTPTATTTAAPTPSCMELFSGVSLHDNGTVFAYDHNCYEFVPVLHTWLAAETDCRRKGGHLVSINSRLEQNVIYAIVSTRYSHPIWLGLNDRSTEGYFQWASGERLSFVNWSSGSRSALNADDHDCIALGIGQPLNGLWQDVSCTLRRFAYVCKFDARKHNAPSLIG